MQGRRLPLVSSSGDRDLHVTGRRAPAWAIARKKGRRRCRGQPASTRNRLHALVPSSPERRVPVDAFLYLERYLVSP